MFDAYLRSWNARPDGEPFATRASHLLPVRLDGRPDGRPAMIKIARHIDERLGGHVMRWWDGDGAARIYAFDEGAGVLLMERATGPGRLLDMALEGQDDAATRIVCRVIARLHARRPVPPPRQLLPLARFFESLAALARREGGLMAECAAVADALLSSQREHVVLHGDAHHGNILDFGARGWLAIDPKRVTGERCYDYVNVLCNPDLATRSDPARFARQLDLVVGAAGLERRRLLQWVMAHAGLSAAWFLEDGERAEADKALAMARLARQALG
ncbi:phosphotransferase [Bordetella petrii]|nr:phosphotransferase [Bordetella petrii]